MKQFLYIATLFVALFFSCMDGNVAYGQNMAREYNPNSPWNKADKTGEYHMERCSSCGAWITGYDEWELDDAMKKHIEKEHSLPNIDGDGSSETPGVGSGSSNDQYSNEASLVYVSSVANAMEIIGKCSYSDFIAECYSYRITTDGETANASNIVGFIRWRYNAKSNIDLQTAMSRGYKFIIFARPRSGKYYSVYTSNWFADLNSLVCDYLIVF